MHNVITMTTIQSLPCTLCEWVTASHRNGWKKWIIVQCVITSSVSLKSLCISPIQEHLCIVPGIAGSARRIWGCVCALCFLHCSWGSRTCERMWVWAVHFLYCPCDDGACKSMYTPSVGGLIRTPKSRKTPRSRKTARSWAQEHTQAFGGQRNLGDKQHESA